MSDDKFNQQLVDMWFEIRALVESIDVDVQKNAKGVVAAGVRSRKGFRLLKKKLSDLSKVSLVADQSKKAKEV